MMTTRFRVNTVCLGLALAASAAATMVPRLSLEQVIESSPAIVHGTVLRSWSAWDANHQFIWTHYELRVAEVLRGAPSTRIVVSEPGGVVGGEGMQIAGAPRYVVGEEVVVAATRTPIGYLRTCGWGQGKFRVETLPDSSVKVVRGAGIGVTLVEPIGAKTSVRKNAGTPRSRLDGLTLTEFKAQLRRLIEAAEASSGGER